MLRGDLMDGRWADVQRLTGRLFEASNVFRCARTRGESFSRNRATANGIGPFRGIRDILDLGVPGAVDVFSDARTGSSGRAR